MVGVASERLNMRRAACGGDHALQLVERVERSLRQHLAVRCERDRVRAPGDRELAPDLGLRLLVEDLELDLRVGGDQPKRGLERVAERAAGRAEDRNEHRRVPLEALDERDPASDLRALVVDREGGLRRDRELQLADLARERQHRDAQDDHRTERDAEADPEPGLGRGLRVGHDGQEGERRREQRRASHRPPADPRARPEAPARRARAAAEDRDDEREREEPEQGRGGRERAREIRGHGDGETRLGGDHSSPQDGPRGRARHPVRRECVTRARAGQQLCRRRSEQHSGEHKSK